MQTTIKSFSHSKILGQVSRLCFCLTLFALAVLSAVGQTPGSLQVGYINTFAGSPVGYASTTGGGGRTGLRAKHQHLVPLRRRRL